MNFEDKVSFDLLMQAIFAFEVLSIWAQKKLVLNKSALQERKMVKEKIFKLSTENSKHKSRFTFEINWDCCISNIYYFFKNIIWRPLKWLGVFLIKMYIFLSQYTFGLFLIFFLFYSKNIYTAYNCNYENFAFLLFLYVTIRIVLHIMMADIIIPNMTKVIRITPVLPDLEVKDWQIQSDNPVGK